MSIRAMTGRCAGPIIRAALVSRGLVAALALGAAASGSARAAEGTDCFRQFERGRGPEIVCAFPARLTEQERADLERLTGGLLRDASCIVSIRVDRARIDAGLAARDLQIEIVPQPVRCELTTREGLWPVTATFAPRITIRDGVAIDATPGLGDVEGVPAALAWPVIHYVNRAPAVRNAFLRAVNAYRGR